MMPRGWTIPRPATRAAATLGVLLAAVAFSVFRGRWPTYVEFHRWLAQWMAAEVRNLDCVFVWLAAAMAGVMLACRIGPLRAVRELGLAGPIAPAAVFAVIATAPMALGFALIASPQFSWSLLRGVLIAPLAEEILFRGYAFTQLHRRAGWPLWLAAMVTGFVFGLAHIAKPLLDATAGWGELAVLGVTSAGGVFYAWLLARWRFNLWVPILLHALMNLWWMLFRVDDSAAGGVSANVCRGLTIAAAIVLTLTMSQRLAQRSRRVSGKV